MGPQLIAIAGSQRGKAFIIDQERCEVGRDSDWLPLIDDTASSHHCVITKKQQKFTIRDLKSRSGTYVNGLPIRKKNLRNGDRIDVGSSMFLFVRRETGPFEPVLLKFRDDPSPLPNPPRIDATPILDPLAPHATMVPTINMVREFQALSKVGALLSSTTNLQSLYKKLMQLIFDIVPAQSGAILVQDQSRVELSTAFSVHRDQQSRRRAFVNRAIAFRVIDEHTAILCNDNRAEASRCQTKSVICAPLATLRQVLGCVFLESRDRRVRFDENHLRLVMALSVAAATVIENCAFPKTLGTEETQPGAGSWADDGIIGQSHAWRHVCDFIARATHADSSVLICGETGTGKELVALAIHRNSPRARKSFVVIDCAALSETLLESDLFGHEKGAFTGAYAQKKGKFEVAHEGTIFLDEVGEIPLSLQARLLRVLQDHRFARVGGTRQIGVDLRVIAATNKNLEQEVKMGRFREDLYYRLNILHLAIPPLRDRIEDIIPLAKYFLNKYRTNSSHRILGFSPEALQYLLSYPWPGNVRELENAVEQAVVLGRADYITPKELPAPVVNSPSDVPVTKYQRALLESKRSLLLRVLRESAGSIVEAARLLEIHPNNLHRLIRELSLKLVVSEFRIRDDHPKRQGK